MSDDRNILDPTKKVEYLARVHRVMDYIEANLDREMTLEELAKVACFSRFHFHRVFTSLVGESLYQFILRLRLEKAASQLLVNPAKSITAVALDCGFGSSATFARAFRAAFQVSASRWRSGGSKKCKTDGKDGKEPSSLDTYREAVFATDGEARANRGGDVIITPPMRNAMPKQNALPLKEAQSVRVEDLPSMTVAYLRHVGPYAGDAALFGGLFGKLMRWAGPRGLFRPGVSKALTIYHDNPDITDEEKLRISVCITVPPGTPVEGEIGTMELPGGKYALGRFELDPSEYGAAWNWLYGKWLPESGYQPDDRPCFEEYLNDPAQHPQHKHVVEICTSVRPL